MTEETMNRLPLILEADPEIESAYEVYVEAKINQQSTIKCLLDTGAATSSLKYSDLSSPLPTVGQKNGSGVFAAHQEDVVILGEIAVGPLVGQNVEVTRSSRGATDVKNIIGMDILGDHTFIFQFKRQQVIVDGDLASFYPKAETSPKELKLDSKRHPYMPVSFAEPIAQGVNLDAVWDTGASLTLVNSAVVGRYPQLFSRRGFSEGIDSTGTKITTPIYDMVPILIGDILFPSHVVTAFDLSRINRTIDIPMDMVLGQTLMQYADWWFDFPKKRWVIAKTHF